MAAASINYGMPVNWFGLGGLFNLLTTLSYRDDQFQAEYPIPEFDQPGFTLWDLSAIWYPGSGRWQVGLYGRNLTDVRYKVAGLDIDLGLEHNFTVYYGNPRQYWLDLQYRFN
jgi:iron complex outermembrane receptor protein